VVPYKYLHIVGNEIKFIKPFVQYVNSNFNENEHLFLILNSNGSDASAMESIVNVKVLKPYDSENGNIRKLMFLYKIPSAFFFLFKYFIRYKKVYIHGLFDKKVILFLYLFRVFLNKSYWIIWGGGDLDVPTEKESETVWFKLTCAVKGGFSNYVTYLPGDYEIAKELYGAKGSCHESLMYESNVYKDIVINSIDDDVTRIQVGNSADSANNHMEILEDLKPFKNDNILIYCILSYGEKPWSKGWIDKVMERGESIFGDKFVAITDFMNYEEYLVFLGGIDIAIFAHKKQQGMGNIISLLGLGKKVFLRTDISSWKLFESVGVKVFDVKKIDIDPLGSADIDGNREVMKNFFSKEKYFIQLNKLFEV